MAANAVNIQANMVLNTQSLNASTREIKQALGRITGNASEFQKSLDASTARVFAFGATTTVINGVTQSFKALVSTTIDVEKRLIEINSIFGGTAREFNAFRDSIFQVAKDTGQSFSTVADAAAEFARQGLSAEETAKRLEAALILTRVSGLDSVKSVSALTAAINGFASAGLTASQITNKLIAVDTAFAVSAKDLADGFSRAGSTAEDAGVSFDELLGIITAVQQKTSRGGAVIGNALKTIFTRIGRQGVIEDLQALGVAIDASQSGVQKLQAIGTAFEAATGDPTRQNAIKELAAGGFQINIISAALKDLNSQYSIYSQATETAAGATDEAFRKNQELNKSLAAQLNSLVVGFTNLAEKVGQLTFAPLLSTLTSLATKVTDFFNEALDPEKGNAFIKGLFKSIGSFLSGPGLLLITTAFFKIITLVAKYAKEGFKSVLSIGAETEKLKNIQVGIVNSLINDQKFRQDILNTTLTQAQKQQAVADAIERENRLLREQQQLLTLLSKQAAVKGVASFNKEKGFVDKSGKPIAASGFVPSFKASAQEAMMESSAAREHGYKAGKVFNTRLYDGSGRSFKATVNSAETIKTVRGPNGKLGTYVIPPNGMAANGFVPNFALNPAARIKAKKINSAGGYIPNFVRDRFEQKFGLKRSTVEREWNAFSKTYPQAPNLRNAFLSDTNTVQAYLQWRKSGEVSIQKTRAKEQSLLETLPQSKRQAKFGFIYPSNQPVVQTKSLKILGEDTAVKFLGVAAEPSDFLYKEVRSSAIKIAKEYAKNIGIRPDVVDENKFESILNQTFNEGSLQSFAGTIFESALQGSIGLAPSSATQGFDIPNKGIMSGLASAFSKISSKNKNQQLSAELSTLDKGDFKNALNDSNINSLINKIINDRAQVSSLNKAPVKKTANAARGYVPNFASPNAIAAMQRLLSDPAATQGEKANARKFLSKFRAGYSFGSTALKGRPISLRQVFDQLDGEVGISQLIDAAYASAGPTASIENVFSKFQQQTLLNPKKLRDLVSKKGYIPNFADPLKEAIGREILAGVPTSQIYIDKSASLKNAMNPMGLMVANRRDEPAGGFQGINRAKKEGLNPKKYGAGKGFIPNYAKKLPPIKIPEAQKPFAEVAKEEENVVGKFEKFSSGLDKAQAGLFGLSVASNTLFEDNKILSSSINALVSTLSVVQILGQLNPALTLMIGTVGGLVYAFSLYQKELNRESRAMAEGLKITQSIANAKRSSAGVRFEEKRIFEKSGLSNISQLQTFDREKGLGINFKEIKDLRKQAISASLEFFNTKEKKGSTEEELQKAKLAAEKAEEKYVNALKLALTRAPIAKSINKIGEEFFKTVRIIEEANNKLELKISQLDVSSRVALNDKNPLSKLLQARIKREELASKAQLQLGETRKAFFSGDFISILKNSLNFKKLDLAPAKKFDARALTLEDKFFTNTQGNIRRNINENFGERFVAAATLNPKNQFPTNFPNTADISKEFNAKLFRDLTNQEVLARANINPDKFFVDLQKTFNEEGKTGVKKIFDELGVNFKDERVSTFFDQTVDNLSKLNGAITETVLEFDNNKFELQQSIKVLQQQINDNIPKLFESITSGFSKEKVGVAQFSQDLSKAVSERDINKQGQLFTNLKPQAEKIQASLGEDFLKNLITNVAGKNASTVLSQISGRANASRLDVNEILQISQRNLSATGQFKASKATEELSRNPENVKAIDSLIKTLKEFAIGETGRRDLAPVIATLEATKQTKFGEKSNIEIEKEKQVFINELNKLNKDIGEVALAFIDSGIPESIKKLATSMRNATENTDAYNKFADQLKELSSTAISKMSFAEKAIKQIQFRLSKVDGLQAE